MRTLDATFTVYLPPRPERVLAFLKERLHCRLLSAERVAFDLVWHDSETRGEHYRHDAPVYRFAHQGLEVDGARAGSLLRGLRDLGAAPPAAVF
jgi:hypothetical protein